MVQRMASPGGPSASALGRETGIAQASLSRWLLAAGTIGDVKKTRGPGETKARTALDKIRLVTEASRLQGEERGAFLRREGVHEADLAEWHSAVSEALQGAPSQAAKRERAKDKQRVKQLERELARKDKALAETAALLVLKKKVQEIWGDEDDDTDDKSEK